MKGTRPKKNGIDANLLASVAPFPGIDPAFIGNGAIIRGINAAFMGSNAVTDRIGSQWTLTGPALLTRRLATFRPVTRLC